MRLAVEFLRSFALVRLRTFLPNCGLRHDVGEKFAKALSRADLLGSFALCLLAVLALALPTWLILRARPSFALNLMYAAVKPPNFIFLKAVNAAKNASLPPLLESKTKILDLLA